MLLLFVTLIRSKESPLTGDSKGKLLYYNDYYTYPTATPLPNDELKFDISSQEGIYMIVWSSLVLLFLLWAFLSRGRSNPNRTYKAGMNCKVFYKSDEYELIREYCTGAELNCFTSFILGSCACFSAAFKNGCTDCFSFLYCICMLSISLMYLFFVIAIFPVFLIYIFFSQFCSDPEDAEFEERIRQLRSNKTSGNNQVPLQTPLNQTLADQVDNKSIQSYQSQPSTYINQTESNQIQVPPKLIQTPPNPNQIQPNQNQVPPNLNQVQPIQNQVPPKLIQSPPNQNQVPPSLNQMQPNQNQGQPDLSQIQQSLNQIQQSLNQMQPNQNQMPTYANPMQPNPNQLPPNLNQAPPYLNQMPLNSNQIPPYPIQMPYNGDSSLMSVNQMPVDGFQAPPFAVQMIPDYNQPSPYEGLSLPDEESVIPNEFPPIMPPAQTNNNN